MSEVFVPFNQLQNFSSDTVIYVMGENIVSDFAWYGHLDLSI